MQIFNARSDGYRAVPLILRDMAGRSYARLADRWEHEAEAARDDGNPARASTIQAHASVARGTAIECRLGKRMTPELFDSMTAVEIRRLGYA